MTKCQVKWRGGCLQEQATPLCHSEPYNCQAEEETLKVSGEESPRIMSGILRAKNNCHPQNDVMVHEPIKFIYKRRGKFAVSKFVKILLTYLPTYVLTRKKAAFTLAEVLITLGIIGVVAAMTLPNIVGYYRKKVVETELKKAFSVISQTIKLSEAFNESVLFWQYPSEGAGSSNTGKLETIQFSEKYIKPYLKYTSAEQKTRKVFYSDGTSSYLTDYINKNIGFIMPDGIFLQFSPLAVTNQNRGYLMLVYVGTSNKGKTKEFVEGKNFFSFTINNTTGNASKIGLDPQWYLNWSCQKLKENPDSFIENCRKNTRETSGVSSSVYCTYMIYCNNWEIPDNYPIKL